MITKSLLCSQVKRLLSSLSDRGSRHLSEIETDLVQTDILVSGAIEKLAASFIAMHAAIEKQQQAVDALLSGSAPTAEITEKLNAARIEIARHANAAVTGLQFQDLTSQLIGRTVTRINGLRDVLDGIGTNVAGMPAQCDAEDIIAALEGINKMLEKRSEKLDSMRWKAVSQTHMGSGDVELF